MNAYCPECETELDQSTGICPACRWDPLISTQLQAVEAPQPELSLTERYRGTSYDISSLDVAARETSVSRGRAFVLFSLIAGTGLYAVVLSGVGPF